MTSKSCSSGRRKFLATAGALGLFPFGIAEGQVPKDPYPVGRALLGVTPGTARPRTPAGINVSDRAENTITCRNGPVTARRPDEIAAQLWYPARKEAHDAGTPIRENLAPGSFPLILYAHAKRRWLTCPEHVHQLLPSGYADYSHDFRRADRMLSKLASHGFIVAAPDLGWLVETFELGDWENPAGLPRAKIMRELHGYLAHKAPEWRIDLKRIGLIGHSTGGAAVLSLPEVLSGVKFVGLIAPGGPEHVLAKARKSPATMVIVSTLDVQLVHDPVEWTYKPAPDPKVLVRIDGANHLGFTDLCTEDNKVCMDGEPPALIDRMTQQDLAATYLSAMARYFLHGDRSAAAVLGQATEARL